MKQNKSSHNTRYKYTQPQLLQINEHWKTLLIIKVYKASPVKSVNYYLVKLMKAAQVRLACALSDHCHFMKE